MTPKNEFESEVRQGGAGAALGLIVVSLVLALAVVGISSLIG